VNDRDCPHGHKQGKCDTCELIAAEKRIAELEKVAEAAAAYRGYFCEIETHRQRERNLDQALREAGYLKEKGDE